MTRHAVLPAAARAEVQRYRDHDQEHFLYRCYDVDGRLLYIGCTQDVVARMMIHSSSWSNPASAYLNLHMDRYEVEGPFIGRVAGRDAERAAIQAETPLLNVHHNDGRGCRKRPQASPITDADRVPLAAALDYLFDGTPVSRRSA